jgi:arylsulfatase A-like enzyme
VTNEDSLSTEPTARMPARVLASLLAIAMLGCGAPRPINVVIIAIDTLRADHLGCYGYPRATSPRMDALAREGVLFEHAIAQSPWTLPSFASMLTGVLPQRHGAGQGKHCVARPCGALVPEFPLLSELFAAAGYRTGSFVSNGFAGEAVGLGRGFEKLGGSMAGIVAVGDALRWMETHREEPLFVFLHLVEPHAPYGPPVPGSPGFVDPAYQGTIGLEVGGTTRLKFTDQADRRRVIDLYDEDVFATDRLVGQVVDVLVRLGIDERTLVVLVSDHGEELFERGETGHGHSLYDELLHVPLILRYPGGSPRGRVAHQVRAMDVFPTVLEAAGLVVPPNLDAVSLDALAHGGPPRAAMATAIAEFTFSGSELRGMRRASQKLVVAVDDGRAQLFDLVADPGETTDLAARRPEQVVALRQDLDATDSNAAPGVYVWARGGARAQRVRVELQFAKGNAARARITSGEAGDVVTLAPDGTSVSIDFGLGAADIDGVRVDMDDPLAPLKIVSATIDGRPAVGVGLRVGPRRDPVQGLPVEYLLTSLAVSRSSPPAFRSVDPVILVETVRPRPRPTLELEAETKERLRALGYVE